MSNSIDLFLATLFQIQVHSKEMSDLHSAITWAFLIGLAFYFYLKRYESEKLSRNTAQYIDQRRHDLNNLVFQSETFLKSASPAAVYLALDGEDETSAKLRMLLSRFEVLAEDVKLGLVSERYIRDSYSLTIIDLMDFAKRYIYLYRINNHRKMAFENIEGLYIRFKFRKDSIIQQLIEWIINKKIYFLSILIFQMKYYFVCELFSLNVNYMKEENDDIDTIIYYADVALHFLMYVSIIIYMMNV